MSLQMLNVKKGLNKVPSLNDIKKNMPNYFNINLTVNNSKKY